jgi:MATE family multidrug resistance protein
MLGAMLLWIRYAPAYRATYPFTHWEWPHWPEIRTTLRLGLPIGVTYFAEVSAFGAVSLLVARYGVVEVSAHQIALNFSSDVHGAAQFRHRPDHPRRLAMGEGDAVRARFVAWVGVGMALAFGLLSALLMVGLRQQIAAAYTSDLAVQALCAYLLLFAALFQLFDATAVAASSAIRGYKVTRADADPVAGVLGLRAAARLAGAGARHGGGRLLDRPDHRPDGGGGAAQLGTAPPVPATAAHSTLRQRGGPSAIC